MTTFAVAAVGALCATASAASAQACAHRGELDELFCDENKDMVADPPKDASKRKDPSTLVFTYTPVEDPAVYENIFKPFLGYLSQCTGKRTVYFQVTSNAAEIEAMRSGRLHVGGFSTGPTAFAVNLAGAVPFAVKGNAEGFESYKLQVIARADGPIKVLTDLKGKKVAHTSATSNSGNLAPRALFPDLGVVPDTDYKVIYSGGHDRSAMGVNSGDYDAAPVASDVFKRMINRGQLKAETFRTVWLSDPFPTSSFAYAHDLKPEFAQKLVKCFIDYRFTEEMKKELQGDDRFVPVTYQKDWAPVRKVAEKANAPYNRAAFDAEARKEAEAAAKKAQQKKN
ncbi:MAG: phosphate/phosphite/phosphonate ABC transporter substrate-binding protein [Alphaproteobacteria bacterium]|nr:phosphate/phosphite/phosphonate ABC transporter substrate-binding protein [Alphaproteobacteria bacterium]